MYPGLKFWWESRKSAVNKCGRAVPCNPLPICTGFSCFVRDLEGDVSWVRSLRDHMSKRWHLILDNSTDWRSSEFNGKRAHNCPTMESLSWDNVKVIDERLKWQAVGVHVYNSKCSQLPSGRGCLGNRVSNDCPSMLAIGSIHSLHEISSTSGTYFMPLWHPQWCKRSPHAL